jgi:hypothetical protein
LVRVRQLLKDVQNDDQVGVVVLGLLAEDKQDFVAWRTLSWGSYEYYRTQMGVPSEAKSLWRYLWWAETAPERLRDSIDYWVQYWFDGVEADDEAMAAVAQLKLENLRALEATIS